MIRFRRLMLVLTVSLTLETLFTSGMFGTYSASAADILPTDLIFKAQDERQVVLGANSKSQWTVLCFLGTECPLAKLYASRLQQLADDFGDQQVLFVGVMSNLQDSPAKCLKYASVHGLSFPVIKDMDQRLADLFGATRTPEVVVIDRSNQVRYRGRIDDQYQPGVGRDQATEHNLRDALQALISGNSVQKPETTPVGCIIGRRGKPVEVPEGTEVTFADDIVPLLQKHCIECHREGQIGPFSMKDYDDVSGWAVTMLETIDDGRMPPWHAAPPHDRFLGARHMSSAERSLLATWIDQGMPAGDLSKVILESDFADGWSLPQPPDVVIDMASKPMKIPAEGTVEYQYFVVDPKFEQDVWVKAAQVIPGNPAVVHHAICFVRPPDGSDFRGLGWLGAYVPGQKPTALGTGMARKVPAGSKFVFQMHYTPTGKPEEDVTRLGIVFANPSEVTEEVITLVAIDQSFEIPPGAADHRVKAYVPRFPRGSKLLSLMPHMHYRGKAFSVTLTYEDGTLEEILSVPRYDFNWQHDYRLAEPVDLDKVQLLECEAAFDNSVSNPWNPNPHDTVMWGDQTWEEMAVAFFDVARPLVMTQDNTSMTSRKSEQANLVSDDLQQRRRNFVDDFCAKLDANKDGIVRRDEVPKAFSAFAFRSFDANGDGMITRDEVAQVAENRIH